MNWKANLEQRQDLKKLNAVNMLQDNLRLKNRDPHPLKYPNTKAHWMDGPIQEQNKTQMWTRVFDNPMPNQ
jgi:hypothetical protein